MRNNIFILSVILLISTSCTKKQDKFANLKTFTKAYGYVKYFHPSDEASNIDWNSFSAYGAEEISKCKNQEEVINTLNRLFQPIAPSVSFSKKRKDYNLETITPENIENYQTSHWQHLGVSFDMNPGRLYKSVRVNRLMKIDETSRFGNLLMSIDPEKYKGKKIKYSGWVKLKEGSTGTGRLWLRVDKSDKTRGFFDNMGNNPIQSNRWTEYEIMGDIDSLASNLVFGCLISGKGTLYLDDVHLYYQEDDQWIEIPIKNGDFEAEEVGEKNEQTEWIGKGDGYSHEVSNTEYVQGQRGAAIKYEGKIKRIKGESIFEAYPEFGEFIQEEIGEGVFCQIPLSLYGNEENTYPKSNSIKELQERLKDIPNNPNNINVRLGNIITTYNVFQHFYPYFQEVGVNWVEELETALERSFIDSTPHEHLITLQKFTASLKDGHITVRGVSLDYVPPIRWEWIEGKLVITKIYDENKDLQVGDIVTKVNNLSAENYFNEVHTRISAGTKGWLDYKARTKSLMGEKDQELILEVNQKNIVLKHSEKYLYGNDSNIEIQENNYKLLDKNIIYLNLDMIEIDTIRNILPKLKEAKGIICDLRGYPNGNHDFISYLLPRNDTSKAWMRVPNIIYPNQAKITGYDKYGWELQAKEPYLGDKKIIFLIDGSAISYAESYMGFIEGYELATIVGQPTAGTNGNVNSFDLPGNYNISWTGMKVFKHDGSQHHAIGVLPDIYVNKTIEGFNSNKDEFLETAINVILK
ncbi:S41 family peptidase [Ekhidna sp.]